MQITVKDRVVKKTGEMKIARKPSKKWCAVQIQLMDDAPRAKAALMIEEAEEETRFEFKGCSSLARNVILETVRIINHNFVTFQKQERNEQFFENFAKAQIRLVHEHKKRDDLVQEAWYDVDRLGAEKLLEGYKAGTYFFRQDPYTALLEVELCQRFAAPIRCVTLTYLDDTSTIRDKTLVYMPRGIAVYDDDPLLRNPRYASLDALIKGIIPKTPSLLRGL